MLVTIITDASRCTQTGASGYGFWIASARMKFGGGGAFKAPTSSVEVAESLAVCNALSVALGRGAVEAGDRILVQTDCTNAIDILSGKRKTLREAERVAFQFLLDLKEKHELSIMFRHVKGHSALKGARYTTNRLCDERAKQGMRAARKAAHSLKGASSC